MYVSRRKRDRHISAPNTEAELAVAETGDSEVREALASETSADAEPLMLERDIYLEPEDEPRENYTASSDDEEMAEDADIAPVPTEPPSEGESIDRDAASGEEVAVSDDPQDLGDSDESTDMSYSRFLEQNTDTGVLRVQASAGGQSIPLSNVNITVYRDFSDGRHIFYQVATNSDGVADGMVLPAPPRINSVEGNGASPFAEYTVSADRDGLRPLTVENVPIFSGVRSIQPIILSPASREV